jgi:hypothetical protein
VRIGVVVGRRKINLPNPSILSSKPQSLRDDSRQRPHKGEVCGDRDGFLMMGT